MIAAASFTSNKVSSLPPAMLSRMPRAPSIEASSSGLVMAWRAALTARPSPDPVPIPMMAEPALLITIFTSAKSVLMSAGHVDEIGDALHTVEQDLVGHRERLDHRRVLVRDRQEALVRDDDERVHLLAQPLDPLVCLVRPPPTLEGERPGHDADRERAEALGGLRDHRRRPGTGAPALAGGDEDHVGALEHLLDLLEVLLGGQTPDLGVAAGAEPARQGAPDVELDVRLAHQQGLRVGVHRDELDALASRRRSCG